MNFYKIRAGAIPSSISPRGGNFRVSTVYLATRTRMYQIIYKVFLIYHVNDETGNITALDTDRVNIIYNNTRPRFHYDGTQYGVVYKITQETFLKAIGII